MRSSSDGEWGAEPPLDEEAEGGRGGDAGAAGRDRGCVGAARSSCTANLGSGRLIGSGGRSRGGRRGSVGSASGSSRSGVPARDALEPEPSRRRRWRRRETCPREPDRDRRDPPPVLRWRSYFNNIVFL